MAHLLDPSCLRDDAAYVAALDELEDLMLADPDTPGGRRFDELAVLARSLGFQQVASGPFVRSSYHADQQAHGAGVA